jgi:DNA repair ATPase RecN
MDIVENIETVYNYLRERDTKRGKEMKKIWAVLIFIVLLICAGCSTTLKSDLEQYIKFDNGVYKEWQKCRSDFIEQADKVDNRREEIKLLAELNDRLEAIANKQNKYKPQTKKVQQIHNKAIKVTEDTRQTINDYIAAVESDTLTERGVSAIEERFQEINSLSAEYHSDIVALQKN